MTAPGNVLSSAWSCSEGCSHEEKAAPPPIRIRGPGGWPRPDELGRRPCDCNCRGRSRLGSRPRRCAGVPPPWRRPARRRPPGGSEAGYRGARATVVPATGVVFTPPAPVIVVPKWVWTGGRWEWHTGGHIWVPEHWAWSGTQWIWIQGHWVR